MHHTQALTHPHTHPPAHTPSYFPFTSPRFLAHLSRKAHNLSYPQYLVVKKAIWRWRCGCTCAHTQTPHSPTHTYRKHLRFSEKQKWLHTLILKKHSVKMYVLPIAYTQTSRSEGRRYGVSERKARVLLLSEWVSHKVSTTTTVRRIRSPPHRCHFTHGLLLLLCACSCFLSSFFSFLRVTRKTDQPQLRHLMERCGWVSYQYIEVAFIYWF